MAGGWVVVKVYKYKVGTCTIASLIVYCTSQTIKIIKMIIH